jgi:hypothetical protein
MSSSITEEQRTERHDCARSRLGGSVAGAAVVEEPRRSICRGGSQSLTRRRDGGRIGQYAVMVHPSVWNP